jgi:hypothetical protein
LTRLRGALVLVAVVTAVLSFGTLSIASQPSTIAPLDPSAFVRIVPPSTAGATKPANEAPQRIVDFSTRNDVVVIERLITPDAPVRVISKAPKPRPAPKASSSGGFGPKVGSSHSVRGIATWFCKTGVSTCTHGYPGGMYAAAGGPLRVGNWRGRHVKVCTSSRCITVKLIDWCACGNGHIIDLYSDAFNRLGSTNQGGLSVTVSW